MESRSDSHEVGKHVLGPHVVGQRVVVRRLVRGEYGPSGGPAMTDLLGTCTAWGDGTCEVTPESGEPVRIPLADIVSGKPVPPRPSVRHRVPAEEAERHALVLWPHVERESLGGWELRSDPAPVGRLLRRANSCLALGDPGVELAEAEQAVHEFYAARSRSPLVQVETASATDTWFAQRGWEVVPGGDAHFQIGSLVRALRAARAARPGTVEALLADQPGPVRLDVTEDGPRVNLEVHAGDDLVAGVRGGIDGDWLGVHALGMVPALRRRGLARRLMVEILEWAAERGATTAWLHVEVDNAPALALYDGLGFRTHHSLRYREPDD